MFLKKDFSQTYLRAETATLHGGFMFDKKEEGGEVIRKKKEEEKDEEKE